MNIQTQVAAAVGLTQAEQAHAHIATCWKLNTSLALTVAAAHIDATAGVGKHVKRWAAGKRTGMKISRP